MSGVAVFQAPAVGAQSGATLTVSASALAPAGTPTIQPRSRATAANAALFFVEVTASSTVTINGFPGFEFALSGLNPSAAPLYIGLYDPTASPAAWQQVEGPGLVGGTYVNFAATQTPITFVGGQTYVFDLYQSTTTPSPVKISPASLSFLSTSLNEATLVTVSEPAYTGAFSLQSTCASIASISPSGNQYIVIPLGAGTCSATFTDASGNSSVLPIVVTVTSGGGQ